MNPSRKNSVSRLKHRITLQEEVQTDDSQGGYIRTWQDVAELWAEILPVTGTLTRINAEILASGQLQAAVIHRILIRYRTGINAGMRFIFDDRAFNIRSVVNIEERNELLEIIAEEGVAS